MVMIMCSSSLPRMNARTCGSLTISDTWICLARSSTFSGPSKAGSCAHWETCGPGFEGRCRGREASAGSDSPPPRHARKRGPRA